MLASIRRYFLCTYLKKTPYKKKSHEPSPKKAIAAKFQKRNQLHKLTTKTDSKSTPSLPGVPKALIAPEPLATRALLHFSADFDEGLGALAESLVRRLSFLAAEQKVHRTDGKIHFSAKFSDFSVKSGETAGLFALRSVSLHLARQPVATHSDFRRLCTAVCWEELVPPLTWPQIRVRAEGKASGLDNALALKAILCEKIFASANDRREPLVAVSLAAKAENPRRRPFLTAGGGRRERKRAKIEERREQMARFDLYSVAANRRNGLSGAPAEWTDADFCVDCLVDASSVATLSIWNDGRDADRAYLADVLVNVSMFRELSEGTVWDPFCQNSVLFDALTRSTTKQYLRVCATKMPTFALKHATSELKTLNQNENKNTKHSPKMSQQLYFATGVRIAPEIADRKTAPFAVQRREGCDTVEAAAVAPADAMLLSLLPTVRRGAAQKYRALSHALLRRPDMRHAVVLTEDSAFERLSLLQWDTVARLGGCAWVLKLNRPRSALLRRLLRRLKSCELDRADKQRLKTEIEDTRAEGAKGESLIERI